MLYALCTGGVRLLYRLCTLLAVPVAQKLTPRALPLGDACAYMRGMLKSILAAFTAPPETPLTHEDCRLALAALMVRVARTDGDYNPNEIIAIDDVLRSRYGMSEAEIKEVRAQAETLEAQAPDTVRFTRLIKDLVPYEERIGVVESLWKVVLSDDQRTDDENAFLRLVVSLIGVADRDSGLARQRVATAQAKPIQPAAPKTTG